MKRTARHQIKFFAAVLLIATLLCGQLTAYAYNPALVTEFSSTEFTQTVPQFWNVRVSNDTLSVELHDSAAGYGRRALLSIVDKNIADWERFQNGSCHLSVSLSDLSDGIYQARLSEAHTDYDDTVWSIADFQVQIADRYASIYFPYGQSERNFINRLNKLYNPKDYLLPLKNYSNLAEMTATAQSITAGCRTDEEKVKAIHDWMTLNFAYDYESLHSGDTNKAADPQHVFEVRRGVCSGFARVARALFTAVGIPCINISGIAHSPLPENAEQMDTNHEWNAVYLNGSWKMLDITWNCRNKYYGKNSPQNVSGTAGNYTYYGIPAEAFGHSHLSMHATGNWAGTISYTLNSPNTYTGKGIEAKQIKVFDANDKLIDRKNYTVTYSNNVHVGTASFTISFMGSYIGNDPRIVNFTIVPKGTTLSKITPASKSLKVSFQKQTTETTGYQIRYSADRSMKNAKIVTVQRNTASSKKIAGLKGNKTYYLQIRTYKTVDGKKYYSNWSGTAWAKTLS